MDRPHFSPAHEGRRTARSTARAHMSWQPASEVGALPVTRTMHVTPPGLFAAGPVLQVLRAVLMLSASVQRVDSRTFSSNEVSFLRYSVRPPCPAFNLQDERR